MLLWHATNLKVFSTWKVFIIVVQVCFFNSIFILYTIQFLVLDLKHILNIKFVIVSSEQWTVNGRIRCEKPYEKICYYTYTVQQSYL